MFDSGFTYARYVLLYASLLAAVYWIATYASRKWNWSLQNVKVYPKLTYVFQVLLVLGIALPILHWAMMGKIPLLVALFSEDYDYIVHLRANINRATHWTVNYYSSFYFKTVYAFLLIVLYRRKQYLWFWVVFGLSVFYGVSLLQKSIVMSILAPFVIYAFLHKKFLISAVGALTIFGSIYFLLYVTNPALRPSFAEQRQIPDAEKLEEIEQLNPEVRKEINESLSIASNSLFKRVFLIPGIMLNNWFRLVPKEKPYLHGDGYRFVAVMRGHEHRDYSSELYPLMHPSFYKRGYHGSVNTASFMYDYVNFGIPGLIFSGVITGLLLALVDGLFRKNWRLNIALNTFFILFMSSSALSTLLLSGGWGIMILLFVLYKLSDS